MATLPKSERVDMNDLELEVKALVINGVNQTPQATAGVVAVGTGGYIDVDGATATLSSNAATITKYAAQITSEALTTAAGAAQAFVITKVGVAATDLAFVTGAGGTNTREHIQYKAVCSTDTITVTLNNIGPTNAVNGTVIFNLWVVKP